MFKIKLSRSGSRPSNPNDGESLSTKPKSHAKFMTKQRIKLSSESPDKFIKADDGSNISDLIGGNLINFRETNSSSGQSSSPTSKITKSKPTIREPLKVKLPRLKRSLAPKSRNENTTGVKCNLSEIKIHKIKLPSLTKKLKSSSLLAPKTKDVKHSESSMTNSYRNVDDLKIQTSDDTNSIDSDGDSSQFNIKVETVNKFESVDELDASFNSDRTISSSDGYKTSSANTSFSSDGTSSCGMQIIVTKSENASGSEIRCPCGVNDDLGVMVECEKCSTWQHGHCINVGNEDDAYEGYICAFCSYPKDCARRSLCDLTVEKKYLNEFSMIETIMNQNETRDHQMNVPTQRPIIRFNDLCQSIIELKRVKNSLEVKWNLLTSQAYEQELRIWQNPIWSDEIRENSNKHKNLYFLDRCKGNLELNIRNMVKKSSHRCRLINFTLSNPTLLDPNVGGELERHELDLIKSKQTVAEIISYTNDLKSKLKHFSG